MTRGPSCPHHSRSIQSFRPSHVPAVSPGLSSGSERRLSSRNAVGRPASGPAAACRDFYVPLFCQVPVIYFALGLHPMELGSVSSGRIQSCSTQGLPAWRRYSLSPYSNGLLGKWGTGRDSNPRPPRPQPATLSSGHNPVQPISRRESNPSSPQRSSAELPIQMPVFPSCRPSLRLSRLSSIPL